jgi:hypothetical protein
MVKRVKQRQAAAMPLHRLDVSNTQQNYTASETSAGTDGHQIRLDDIEQGSGFQNRLGRKAFIKHVDVRLTFTALAIVGNDIQAEGGVAANDIPLGALAQGARILLLRKKDTAGETSSTDFTISDVLTTGPGLYCNQSLYNLNNIDQYEVLCDHKLNWKRPIVQVSDTTTAGADVVPFLQKHFEAHCPVNKYVQYTTTDTSGDNIQHGRLRLCILYDGGMATTSLGKDVRPQVSYQCRVRFYPD